MSHPVNPQDAVSFLQELIRIDSTNPPGGEHRVAEVLAARLRKSGLPVRILPVGEGRSNLEARLPGNGGETLCFCGHMDTVGIGDEEGWFDPPFSGAIVGNRLFGRGASDMKSGLAAMALAMESLSREGIRLPGDLVLLATAGEEVDCCGARQYAEQTGMQGVDALVIGEPTGEKVVAGHKGALWLEMTVHGKTAHGAMPDEGVNAIDHMIDFIQVLKRFGEEKRVVNPVLGAGSLSVTRIDGGFQTNVVPDRCVMHADIRSVPPQTHEELVRELQQRAEALIREQPGLRIGIRTLLDRTAVVSSPSCDLIRTALEIKGQGESDVHGAAYYTDASVLNPDSDIPMLIYGPGDEKLAHQPDEWVDLDAYLRSIAFYRELALRYLDRA